MIEDSQMPLKYPENLFQVLEGIVKDYFPFNYSEMDFGKRGMERLTLKHGTLKSMDHSMSNMR